MAENETLGGVQTERQRPDQTGPGESYASQVDADQIGRLPRRKDADVVASEHCGAPHPGPSESLSGI